jgi:hypothetical protein
MKGRQIRPLAGAVRGAVEELRRLQMLNHRVGRRSCEDRPRKGLNFHLLFLKIFLGYEGCACEKLRRLGLSQPVPERP